MNEIKNWTEILLESYASLVDGLIVALPRIIIGILLFFLGWLLARFLSRFIARSLKLLRFDDLMKKLEVEAFLQRLKIENTPSQIAGRFVYWIFMLLIFVGFAEAMKLSMVSQKIGALINYVPNIIIAAMILIVGLYMAGKLKEIIETTLASYAIKTGRLVGSIIFYLLAIFIFLTALEQLKFNIDLLTSNIMILLGGVALAFAIGYGLAAREIFPNIISAYYSKGLFQVGNRVRLGKSEGKIIEITNLSVVIQTESGKKYIPAKKLITEEVEILSGK